MPCCGRLQEQPSWQTQLLDPDGLHLLPAGNAAVWLHLQAALRQAAPQLLPEALPRHMPHWDQVDGGDPGSTFAALYVM
jgi:hypothetical protein